MNAEHGAIYWRDRAKAAEKQVEALKKGLRRYGEHDNDCAFGRGNRCTCGFHALVGAPEPAS